MRVRTTTLACTLALACAVAGTVAPGALAGGSWLGPQTISDPTAPAKAAGESAAAMGPTGDAVVAWPENETGTVAASVRPAGGSFSGRMTVASEPGDTMFSVGAAINASGEAVVAWQNLTTGTYEASIRPPGGAFSAPVVIASHATLFAFQTPVAIDDAGEVIVGVFTENGGNDVASYAWRPAGGSFSLAELSSPFTATAESRESVALNRAGDAIVAWADKTGSGKYLVKVERRAAGGAFGAPQTLSDSAADGLEPTVAIAAGGQSAVAWTHTDSEGHPRIQASTSTSAAGALSAPQTISPTFQTASYPAAAVSAGGQAVVVWTQSPAAVEIAGGPVGGAFGPVTEMSPFGGEAEVAIDSAGEALAAWASYQGGPDRVETASRAPDGAVSTPVRVSTPGDLLQVTSNVPTAHIGMDEAGDAVAGWTRFNDKTAQANIFSIPPPSAPASTPPVTQPAPVAPTPLPPVPAPVRCVVPKLNGLSSAAARRRLLAAHCALGKASVAKRYRHAKRLVVATQSVRAGTSLAAGAKVNVTLKPPPPPRHRKRHH